jgi:fatty acid desaturase
MAPPHIPELPYSNREVHAEFAPDTSARYDRAAFGWVVVFYAAYAALLGGLVPGWAFFALGTVAIVRNFNALHEAFHAVDVKGSIFVRARAVPIVMAPWQLGYAELKNNHTHHHRHEGGDEDPDRYLIRGNPLWTLLMALTQPEQSVVRYVRRKGWSWSLGATLAFHAAVWVGLALVSPLELFVLYNVVTRFGNTAAWWIFDYLLHLDALYYRLEALPMPRPLRWAWAALFSHSNIKGVLHHYLHHRYPFVPDRRLPELAAFIEAAPRTGREHAA